MTFLCVRLFAIVKYTPNKNVKYINEQLKTFCSENNVTYIDLYDKLADGDGDLRSKFSEDGLHLTEAGYNVVTETIKSILNEK